MIGRSSRRGRRSEDARVVLVVALALVTLAAVAVPSGVALSDSRRAGSGPTLPADSKVVCNGAIAALGHISVGASGCQAVFSVGYDQNFSYYYNSTNLTWKTTSPNNISFALSWIAEVTPGGQVVRLASPLAPSGATTWGGPNGNEISLTDFENFPVTNGSGNWTPNATWSGTHIPTNVSNASLGTASMETTFNLENASAHSSAGLGGNTTYSVEFTLLIGGWPWASAADHLGFALESLGARGSHFSFNASSGVLSEGWNSTNRTFVSLVFGSEAYVNETSHFPETPSIASVGEQVGLFAAPSYDRDAQVLLTFGGVAGGFWNVTYDPWVVFNPANLVGPPPPPPPSGGFLSWAWVAVALVASTAGLGTIGTVVLRNLQLHREGRRLVGDMRRAIAASPKPPSRGG